MQSQQELVSILDAIEMGKYKSAYTMASKCIKKNKDSPVLKAMLAYASERTGRQKEALQLCSELLALRPPLVDDLSLQLLQQTLRYCRRGQDVVTLYANASQAMPYSLEYATHYFMSLVRVGDLKQQQMVALRMQKQFKENKYFFWAVTAIYLQGVNAAPGAPNIFFPLAEKMLQKAVEEKRITHFEEVYLYMLVLDSQKKYLACVKLLSSELATSLCKVESELKQLVLKYMHMAEQTDSVIELCREGLRETPDDWRVYVTYVEALYQYIVEQSDEPVSNAKDTQELKDARKFLADLQTSEPSSKGKGPFLGEMELLLKFEMVEDLVGCLSQYFQKFGATISFFEDVKRYLTHVPAESREAFVAGLSQLAVQAESDEILAIRKRINLHKVKYCVTSFFSEKDTQKFIEELMGEYNAGLELGKDLKSTERQHGDDCVVIAALLLLDQFQSDRKKKHLLYHAILILETGLQKSVHNFQMKIMLIRLYAYLGVSQPVVTHSLSLDVKQVLLDTLTYIYGEDFEYFAPIDVAEQVAKKPLQIYTSNEKETPEMLIQAFKFSTYSKIPEFHRFQKRLSDSIQQAISKRQIANTNIILLSKGSKAKDLATYLQDLKSEDFNISDARIDALQDNRDLTVGISWKAGGKSFFEVCAGAEFPKSQNAWLRHYGALPVILKSWLAGTLVEASLLAAFNGLTDEENLGLCLVRDLSSAVGASNIDEPILTRLQTNLDSLKQRITNLESFESSKQIYKYFEALVYARIASTLLAKKLGPGFIGKLEGILQQFMDYLMALHATVSEPSIEKMKQDWVYSANEKLPLMVDDTLVKNVLASVQSSRKSFLMSMVNHLG
ncbi:N-acetyltransferase B complex non catalytic subunit-domain-containing protein [Chytriomyces cf. hyalinus JEL632]|nr:N-acetyltransferase B complex non catalytic subunit-domain-containing protein [Chytriomyces cf. hyalinus JEL632]